MELDRRLSRLTWFEVGLWVWRPTPFDRGAERRRNRFAALRLDVMAGRTSLSRATRVRAVKYLLREVQDLRAGLAGKGWLTGIQLARLRWIFGGHPCPVWDYFVDLAGRSGQTSAAMLAALTIEEGRLVGTLKIVRRVPDPVPRLTAGQMQRLSTGQLLRLFAAAQREQREGMLLVGLAAGIYETNPPRH